MALDQREILKHTKTKYIAFLDADGVVKKQLQHQFNLMEKNNYEITHTNYFTIDMENFWQFEFKTILLTISCLKDVILDFLPQRLKDKHLRKEFLEIQKQKKTMSGQGIKNRIRFDL